MLTALSEELGGLVEHVGGPEYAHVLLSPLENLAAIEEPLVREKVGPAQHTESPCAYPLLGRGITEQDLSRALPAAGRGVFHPAHSTLVEGRLVHFEDLGYWTIRGALHESNSTVTRAASPAVWATRSR